MIAEAFSERLKGSPSLASGGVPHDKDGFSSARDSAYPSAEIFIDLALNVRRQVAFCVSGSMMYTKFSGCYFGHLYSGERQGNL